MNWVGDSRPPSNFCFWATVTSNGLPCYGTVVLSVCSLTLAYCVQTVGWIKMPLGTEVGLGPGHIVLDGDPAAPCKRAQQPPLSNCWAIVLFRVFKIAADCRRFNSRFHVSRCNETVSSRRRCQLGIRQTHKLHAVKSRTLRSRRMKTNVRLYGAF